MSTPLLVRMPDGGPVATIATEVLASLPLSYAAAGGRTADVQLVDGAPDWPAALVAAARDGAAGLIVVDPGPADLLPLADLGATVVVDSVWAGNPAIEVAAPTLRAALVPGTRLECRAVVSTASDAGRVLLAQLTLVRRLAGPADGLTVLHRDGHGYLARGSAGGAALELTMTTTNALSEHATVRLLTGDGGIELFLPAADTARPAQVHLVGPDGDCQLPTLYESAHRTAWRRLHQLLIVGDSASDLDDLTDDLATLRAAGGSFS